MRRFLLDTGIASQYMDRRSRVFQRARHQVTIGDRVGICMPVLGELYYGIEYSDSREKNLQKLRNALVNLSIWPYTKPDALEYGRLAAVLRRAGRPIQQIDIQIAAIAITFGNCTVVTTDSDFGAVPGLRIENWASP